MDLGTYLRGVRESRGWSLRDAALKLGVSHVLLMRVEKGFRQDTGKDYRPQPDLLAQIAKGYGIPEDTIFIKAGYLPRSMWQWAQHAAPEEVQMLLAALRETEDFAAQPRKP